jgi:hypothetical protein
MRHQIRRRWLVRNASGPAPAEAFVIIAIATILITRLYLRLTGYPQVGGGNLHIAHALYGGALMMLALLFGWLLLGFGARLVGVVLGGIGLGLFLDEVGKFVTKNNDYFYGPAAEIMYILIVLVLVATRVLHDLRPPSAQECLASATAIAADGLARGLADHRRHIGLSLVEYARARGADSADVDRVRALLISAPEASDHLYTLEKLIPRLIPGFLRSPRWVPVVGWMIVVAALFAIVFRAIGVRLGGNFYQDHDLKFELVGINAATMILLVSALLTFFIALPAMLVLRRTNSIRALRWLRNAALIFTLLNALVNFATEGFAALITLSIGLFALAILSYQLHVRERAIAMSAGDAKGEDLAVG